MRRRRKADVLRTKRNSPRTIEAYSGDAAHIKSFLSAVVSTNQSYAPGATSAGSHARRP